MDTAPSPAPRNDLAFGLSLASLLVAPFAYLGVGLVSNGRSDSFAPLVAVLGLGAPRTAGVIGLVFSALSLVTGFYGGLFGLFAAGGGPHGRPLRVGGHPTVAGADEGDGWSGDDVQARVEGLDDEAREARVAFALAARYGGRPVGPTALPAAREVSAPETPAETLRRVARESLVDGVLGEGAAAIAAAREAEREADPAVAEVLWRIARDEADHAALGEDVVHFCARRDGDVDAELRALAAAAASGEGDAARCAERFLGRAGA